jgi:RNA polymerase sigma-70 factor (ECF subfamily)
VDSLGITLASAQAGDEVAFTRLFREFNPQILRYLRHQVIDVADDLASETWLAAAKGFRQFQGNEGDFRAWLFSIARRRVIDHRRRQSRRPRLVHLEAHVERAARSGEVEADVLESMSAQEAIDALVAGLPGDQAEVVLLRVVADLSVAEVARILGHTPAWVRVTQHRALRRLREGDGLRNSRQVVTG